jgi:hypothetical protein
VPHSVEGIQHGLSWAGLDYDFGMFSVVTLPWLVETTVIRHPLKGRAEMALMALTSKYVRSHVSPLEIY